MKKILLTIGIVFSLATAPAHALDISDYTAYPPFLPRMVSPNILFMLDSSESMVRPAYGNCKTIADIGNEGVSDSDSGDINISNCRYRFSDVNYDYSSSTTYSGYFDASGVYNCSGGGACTKNSAGVWSGNFLNWLTMTQFDIVKKVVVGGDVDSAPEMGNPTKLWSKLKQANNESDADYRKFRKTVNLPSSGNSTSCSSTDLPSGLCTQWPSVTYDWQTSASMTDVFDGSYDADDSISPAQPLPFPFTFYGNTYTQIYIDTNGTIRFAKEIFRDGAESGTGSWTATGLWKRQGSGDSCTNAATGSASWYYGAWNNRDAWCNFETPITTTTSTAAATSGTLTSGTISLPASTALAPNYLGFAYFYETETTGRRYVEISTDNGASWPYSIQLSGDTMNTWLQKQINLSDYIGYDAQPNVKIRFSFNSGDGWYNAFRGWYVDDILIYTKPTTSYPSNVDIPDTSAPNNMIAPYWDDLMVCDNNNTGACGTYQPALADRSYIKTFTTGTAPNRIFVTTFYKMIHKDDTGKANPLTFQVLLYEGSNHIVFNYKTVEYASTTQTFREGRTATIGVENSGGTGAKKYSHNGSALLHDGSAIFASPHLTFALTPSSSQATTFQPAAPLAVSSGATRNDYSVYININSTGAGPTCSSGSYLNKYRNQCYDHETEGLLQDFRDGELGGTLGFRLAIMQLNDTDGGAVTKHFNEKDTAGWSSLLNNTRSMSPKTNTPLAEALQTAEGYFKQDTSYKIPTTATDTNSWVNFGTGSSCDPTGNQFDPFCFQSAAQRVSCCKSFVLIVSSGNYSNDNRVNIYGNGVYPNEYGNYNGLAMDANGQLIAGAWRATPGETFGMEGSGPKAGWLDNVAYKAHTTDWRPEMEATQNLTIYTVNTFGAGSGTGTYALKKAAKYGGFEDKNSDNNYNFNDANGNGRCDTGETWEDDKNCDGVPDTYFEASGGSNMKDQIVAAVSEIMKSSASGTSVSVLSTSAGGEGAIYQAYFYPAKAEGSSDERTWPGYLRAFFLDIKQNLRDDYSGGLTPDAKQVMANDRVVRMTLNTTTNAVDVNLYTDADGIEPFGTAVPTAMDDIISIWEGGKKLALRDKSTRHIYTWLDTGGSSLSTSPLGFSSIGGTAKDFIASQASSLKSYLRANAGDVDGTGPLSPFTADKEAEYIIRFTRGEAITPGTTAADGTGASYRNRCISITGADFEAGCTGTQRVWALGDIVYSTPTLVSAPGEKYDQIYSDSRYKAFSDKYQHRRSVVYVGANDGMLHAFNAGVFTGGDDSTTSDVEAGRFATNSSTAADGNGFANGWTSPTPGLGDELWAFVPYDDLPHLAWQACNGTSAAPTACGTSQYTHVFYVDQRPKATDVRIFNNSDSVDCPGGASGLTDGQVGACHPGGWGTILIVPLRLGGGAMDVTADFGSGSVTKSFRSAFYVFDVTDPEKPPKLLWRYTNSELGFTTSYPAIVKIGAVPSEKWYMVFGSGPNNDPPPTTATLSRDYFGANTTQTGKVFVLDISDGSLKQTLSTGVAKTFMGDPAVVDENLDFTSDTIYIGSATIVSATATSGKVYRIRTKKADPTSWELTTLIDTQRPVLVAPSIAKDAGGHLWVFFGTGRLRGMADLSNFERQTFYGIKDGCGKSGTAACGLAAYAKGTLLDSSNLQVCSSGAGTNAGAVFNSATGGCGTGTSTYNSYATLQADEANKNGWYVDFPQLSPATLPSERALSRAAVLGGLVLFTTYTPASDMCSVLGDSKLYSLYYETGTAYKTPTVGTTGSGTSETVNKSLSLGKGMPTAVGIAIGETMTGFVQKSTGEIVRVEAQPGLSVKSGAAAWREKTGGSGTSEIEMIYKHIIK